MLRRLVEWLAAWLGLEVVDPSEPPTPAERQADVMADALRREVERAHENTARAFTDYEHRIEVLTIEIERLKRELHQK